MENQEYYQVEPQSFYEALSNAYAQIPDYDKVYERYSRLLSLFTHQSTAQLDIKFTGTFSIISYLLRQHDADKHHIRTINDARVRIRNIATLTHDDKHTHAAADLEALAHLISIVTRTQIPDTLAQHFPEDKTPETHTNHFGNIIRMIVDTWNDQYITGRTDDENAPEIHVAYTGATTGSDNTYIKDMLTTGARLNLIAPHEKDDVLYPDHIIYEPDILIDVTAIASCFQDYSTTHLTNIINKFTTVDDTPAIVLGNLAGQMLDEEINLDPHDNTIQNSIREFYARSPLSLITSGITATPKDRNQFIADAQQQKQNIRRAIRHTLPREVGQFNPHDIILEPSFISEMLGVQGRMDFLQLDKKVVIEQKSGKCGFPQYNPDVPVNRLTHYIQVLLYMMVLRYNYADEYKKNHGTQAFLLYSKYKESLLATDFAPRLIHDALKIRNQIVDAEYHSTDDGYTILDAITPADLLHDSTKARFFSTYVEPKIKAVLTPIQTADPLTRAYFHRFVRFTATEHILSRIGTRTKANTGFAAVWNDSLDEKLQAGNIYAGLTIRHLPVTEGKVQQVILTISTDTENDMSNFRPGDIVMLYPYPKNTEPDARRAIIFRGNITDITVDAITIELRSPQSSPNVFTYYQGHSWAVEHDFMESSYTSLYRGLHTLLTTPKDRRDLILMQRQPRIDDTLKLNADYGTFNPLMLSVKQAQDIYLILGPPGSGKTSFGMLNTLKEQLTEPDTSVILLSYTNRAVDEICSKLDEARIDFIRIGSTHSCSPEYADHLISRRVRQCPKMADMEQHLRSTRVYVGTVTALNGSTSLFKLKTFQLAIIDEASQILEPHLMPLLCATDTHGSSAIKKFVMIGDHKQLPAVVQQSQNQSAVTDKTLNAIGITDCRSSLFQRFYEAYGTNPAITSMLTRQGRMHHDIASFSNTAFYADRLTEVPLEHQLRTLPEPAPGTNGLDALVTARRTAFIAVPAPHEQYTDKVNQNEADVIASLVYHIYQQYKATFSADHTVGVIVPYRNQISTVRNTIARRYNVPGLADITIDTVERYQGSQRTCIIYGFTVSKKYQLNFLTSTNFTDTDGRQIDRKLNVAMTRAMEHLYLVGNPDVLVHNSIYRQLIKTHKEARVYYEMPLQRFLDGSFRL